MRFAFLILSAALLAACEATLPHERFLEWEPAAFLGDSLMRTPDDRLCTLMVATYSQGQLLMPGLLACDSGDRKLVHVIAPQGGISLTPIEAPVTPAIASSSSMLYRFDPGSGALRSGPSPAPLPAALDSRGRPLHANGRLYRSLTPRLARSSPRPSSSTLPSTILRRRTSTSCCSTRTACSDSRRGRCRRSPRSSRPSRRRSRPRPPTTSRESPAARSTTSSTTSRRRARRPWTALSCMLSNDNSHCASRLN